MRNDDHLHLLKPGFPGVQMMAIDDRSCWNCLTGSACTAGTIQPSHNLEALSMEKIASRLKESLRISFSELNTIEEVQDLLTKLKEILS